MAALTPSANIKTNVSTPELSGILLSDSTPRIGVDTALDTTESTFPSASLFTFLPELYLVISRLRELRNKPEDSSAASNGLTQTLSHDSQGSVSLTRSDPQNTPLEVRDLPGQIFSIRKGIAQAKDIVRGLPDITRSVEAQEAEMRELRISVAGLRGRLGELSSIAKGDLDQDTVMQGTGD